MREGAKRNRDPYTDRFLSSPLYVMIMSGTIKTAARSYNVARVLSVVSFGVGVVLIGFALLFAVFGNESVLTLILGGLGTVNLVALLLYRPIERVQSGVNELIKSQIACASFLAQYDSIARTLHTMGELPLAKTDRNEQLRLVGYLQKLTSTLMADLDGRPERIVELVERD